MTPDIIKHIDSHVRKAERLHPVFCNGLIPESISLYVWQHWEEFDRHMCEDFPNAYNILKEEESELFHALAKNELSHARSEIYDCIAVLIRLDQEIIKKINGGE